MNGFIGGDISPGIGESEENFSNCGCSTCNCRTQRLINEFPSSIPFKPKYNQTFS
jgi:hypothetical protein